MTAEAGDDGEAVDAGDGADDALLMAELIVLGRAVTVDVSAMDLGRFARGEARVETLTFV